MLHRLRQLFSLLGDVRGIGLDAARAIVRRPGRRGPIPAIDRGGRTLELIGAGQRIGRHWAGTRARMSLTGPERHLTLEAEFELQMARELTVTLGGLRAGLTKAGQMASYLDLGMSEAARGELAQLQADAPPMPADVIAAVVEREFGEGPSDLFADWDPNPIGAGSIAQVHRAALDDGRAVAVKIRYPGVDRAMSADLEILDRVTASLGRQLPGLDLASIVAEVDDRLREECDLSLEARHQTLFADYLEDHPFLAVPAVIDELTSERVLTMELVAGDSFGALVRATGPDADHRRACGAEALFRSLHSTVSDLGYFHADPNPGNLLFGRDGSLTIVDFGSVKDFRASVDDWAGVLRALAITGDDDQLMHHLTNAGMLDRDTGLAPGTVRRSVSTYYQHLLVDEPFTFTHDYSMRATRMLFGEGSDPDMMKAATLPPDWVLMQRVSLGQIALLAELGATANWRRIGEELWPGVGGPPSTPMGEAHAVWKTARDHGRE